MVWLSCILTFFLMNKMFEITREKLTEYIGGNSTDLYNKVKTEAKTGWNIMTGFSGNIKNIGKYVKGK